MINLLLFIIAVILTGIMSPIAIIYLILDTVFDLLGKIALSIDMAGNVLLSRPMNDILIKKNGYQFGNRKETISSALGKNKLNDTLTKYGRLVADILDKIDENHCIKSIDNNV